MRPLTIRSSALCLALFLLAGASDVMAERLETASISESPWTFNAYIDGWLPHAPVDINIDGNDIELPESLKTILRSMKFTTMLRLNAHKGPLGFFVNPIFYKGEYDNIVIHTPIEDLDGDLQESVWLVDYGISYEIARWDLGKDGKSRVVTLEPYAGFRYFWDNLRVTVEPGIIEDGFVTRKKLRSNSPIIGLQSGIQLNDKWDFRLVGDYGGFSVNHMDNTYQMAGYFHYGFKIRTVDATAYLGYRFLHLDLEHEGESVTLAADIKGPLLGIGFTF
jgi:hypothetical protein